MKYLAFLWSNIHFILLALCVVVCRDYQAEVNEAILPILIPALVSAAASGVGALVANRKKKKALDKMNRHYDNLIDETEAEMNSNFLDRADSQDALRKITDSNTEALRQLNTDATRQGATDEAKVAMANNLTKRTADAVGQLSALGEQHKDKLRAYRNNLKEAKATQNFNAESDVSGMDSIVQGISQVANAFGSTYATRGAKVPSLSQQTAAIDADMANTFAGVQAANDPKFVELNNKILRYGLDI